MSRDSLESDQRTVRYQRRWNKQTCQNLKSVPKGWFFKLNQITVYCNRNHYNYAKELNKFFIDYFCKKDQEKPECVPENIKVIFSLIYGT